MVARVNPATTPGPDAPEILQAWVYLGLGQFVVVGLVLGAARDVPVWGRVLFVVAAVAIEAGLVRQVVLVYRRRRRVHQEVG